MGENIDDVYAAIDRAMPLIEETLLVMKLRRIAPERLDCGWSNKDADEQNLENAIRELTDCQKYRIPF